ncbi:MAG: hypothetical protein EBT36_14335, partial [Betaproteobacteria bacterium]|nr:hypothetical protein [Betaproteobacteria bacterium]
MKGLIETEKSVLSRTFLERHPPSLCRLTRSGQRAFPEYIDYCPALLENGCLRVIRGSHRDRSLRRHHTVQAGDVTPTQALDASEFDETNAVDLVLKAGQISLHDVFLLHGSEPNLSSKPRRGMTMRFMP